MRIPFTVIASDSSASGCPASNLHDPTPHSPGWISGAFPSYPQELLLAFSGAVELKGLKLLSHPAYVASKIEVFTGRVAHGKAPSVATTHFTPQGYVRFAQDARAQQVQHVHVEAVASFLKLLVHEPLPNPKNLCAQVGLIDLLAQGEVALEESTRVLRADAAHGVDFELLLHGIDLEEDFVHAEAAAACVEADAGRALREVRRLRADREVREQFDLAARLAALERRMAAVGGTLLDAEAAKRAAVAREDYAAAAEAKRAAADLRAEVAALLREARLPPGAPSGGGGVPRPDSSDRAGSAAQRGGSSDLRRRIMAMEREKLAAVASEDYAAAKELKSEVARLMLRLAAAEHEDSTDRPPPPGFPSARDHSAPRLPPQAPPPLQLPPAPAGAGEVPGVSSERSAGADARQRSAGADVRRASAFMEAVEGGAWEAGDPPPPHPGVGKGRRRSSQATAASGDGGGLGTSRGLGDQPLAALGSARPHPVAAPAAPADSGASVEGTQQLGESAAVAAVAQETGADGRAATGGPGAGMGSDGEPQAVEADGAKSAREATQGAGPATRPGSGEGVQHTGK